MSTGKTGGEQAPATKDTFLKSLDALKQVLLIDSPTKRLLNQDVDQRLYKERQEYETKINEQKKQIELLAKKLAESTAKAEREQSLRTSLERIEFATKELNSQLREVERSNSSTPLESKIAALEVDMKKRQADFMDEKTKFDQQMKALAAEKEDALNKKNEIEARFLGAQKVSLELTARLKMSEKSLIEEKAHHKDFVRSLQHANKILVQAMESVKDAKVLIEKELASTKEELEETQSLLQQATEPQADSTDGNNVLEKQMSALAAEKEDALNKKNEIEARLLGAQKVSLELTARLETSEKSLIEEKARHTDFVRGLENANKLLVQAMESGKAAKEMIEKELASVREELEETQSLLQQATEQVERGDTSSKASEEQLERANDEIQDLQRALEEAKKEGDDSKTLLQDLKEKSPSLSPADQTEKYEDLKSQLLSKGILAEQVKKMNVLLKRKMERMTGVEEALKKQLEEFQLKPKGDQGTTVESVDEEAKEVKDELVLAEQEVKRSRSRIQALEKQVQHSHQEIESLKEELETKKRVRDPEDDSADAQVAEDSPEPKKPRADFL